MAETKVVDVPINPVHHYPPHVGGDREFKGHGPDITVIATLVKQGDHQLTASVYTDAIETRQDWTHFQGWSPKQVVFNVDADHPGWRIQSILTDTSSSLSVRDHDHAPSKHGPDQGGLVREFTVHGDQNGQDQPWVRADFNPAKVRLVK